MSTFTNNKGIEQPAHNSYTDTWDTPVNADWAIIDNAFGSSVSLNSTGLSGPQTLALSQYQPLTILVSGLPTSAITYVVPSGVGGQWIFVNGTSGGFNVGIASAAGGPTILVPAGANTIVSCDGSSAGMRLAVNVPPAAAGSNTQLQYNSGGVLAGSANLVFDGTTLSVTGLSVGGNAILGNGSGSFLTIYGTAVTIPNGLNIGGNNLFLNGTQVGIGTATLAAGNLLTVAGNIKITTGGLIFSDGTQLLSAAALAPSGPVGAVQLSNGAGGFTSDSVFTYNTGTHTLSATNLVLGTPLPVASGGTGGITGPAAIANLGIINQQPTVPTTRTFRTPGAFTYTPTSGAVVWIKVRMAAGGGGGGGVGGAVFPTGATGGVTSFGSVQTNGGVGGTGGNGSVSGTGGAGGTGGSGLATLRLSGTSGSDAPFIGSTTGSSGAGGSTPFFGGGAGALGSNTGTGGYAGAPNSGGGGSGAVAPGATEGAGGGGSGEYVEVILPATSYSGVVGTGGAGGIGGNNTGGAGANGIITVEEHYNY